MTISEWIRISATGLADAGIPSARLDTELILAHTLRKSRTFLHAHSDETLSSHLLDIADARVQMRLDRTPLAYIIGHKEFYGRRFRVTPSTLIPRPESETMISMLEQTFQQARLTLGKELPKLVDVGTGSGCLGITAKLEHPELDVTLIDSSRHALTIAEANARRLNARVTVLRSDLLVNYPFKADFVLANLPYVDESWDVSPETRHEPKEALFAPADGLGLIYRLLAEAPARLNSGASMFLEADPRQHAAIIKRSSHYDFRHEATEGFILHLRLY